MEIIRRYFESLSQQQIDALALMYDLYNDWNTKINVISRKDFQNFYVHHVLHSLSILKFFNFTSGTTFLDVGTGGGFPGIPLAICLPHCHFTLNDSIGKKMKVVEDVVKQLHLKNVALYTGRAETIQQKFDFITGRGVTALQEFIQLIGQKISDMHKNPFPNGILYLKGGDFEDEIRNITMKYQIFQLSHHFEEDYFTTKKLVYLWHCS